MKTLFAAIAVAVVLSACKPACTVIDLAHEACVLIPMIDKDGNASELRITGKQAIEYLRTGQQVAAGKCP